MGSKAETAVAQGGVVRTETPTFTAQVCVCVCVCECVCVCIYVILCTSECIIIFQSWFNFIHCK
jgi:hypothetical protein